MINKTQDMNEMQTRMEQMARVIHNKVGKGMRLGIMFLGMIPATALGFSRHRHEGGPYPLYGR